MIMKKSDLMVLTMVIVVIHTYQVKKEYYGLKKDMLIMNVKH